MSRKALAAVTLTCLVAAVSYAGAVSTTALLAGVLPSVLLAAAVGAWVRARRTQWAALIVGAVVVLGASELVNVWSGESNGPAARSTFVAAGCTLLAVVAAWSRSPALFLAPLAGIVFGALALGAGGEVRSVAVVAAVFAVVTLGWIEQARRNWAERRPRRGAAMALLSLLVGVAAALIVLLQAQHDAARPELLARAQAKLAIKPGWTDPFASATTRRDTTAGLDPGQSAASSDSRQIAGNTDRGAAGAVPVSPTSQRAKQPSTARTESRASGGPATRRRPADAVSQNGPNARTRQGAMHTAPSGWPFVLLILGILLLLLAVAVVVRRLYVKRAWRRIRRQLRSGDRQDQIAGAWVWARLHLAAARMAVPPHVSPDVALRDGVFDDMPPGTATPLGAVAQHAALAAFATMSDAHADEVEDVWAAAASAAEGIRNSLTRRARLRLAFRRPAAAETTHSRVTAASELIGGNR
jgi:hypothetical protein